MGKTLTKWAWRIFIGGILFFTITIFAINLGLLGYMPSIQELENPESNEASIVYAADGSVLGRYFYENRVPVTYQEISKNVTNALIATEDERFHEHSGIDGIAILRAVVNLGNKGGGSTLTQQLAKNLFPRQNVSIFSLPFIKLKEWVTAVKLERNLTKNEIITLYLNTVPFGGNIFGIKTAANTFFGKEPKDLTVDEAAILVGMLKANTRYNPRRNPENSKERRNVVIQKMVDNNFLSPSEGESYKSKPIVLNYKESNAYSGKAPYFRQVLQEELKKWCKTHTKEDGTNYDVFKDGLRIYTTLDSKMQEYAEEAVEEHLKEIQPIFWSQGNIKSGKIWEKKVHAQVLENVMERSDRYINMEQAGMSDKDIVSAFNVPVKMKVFTYSNEEHEKDTVMSPLDSIKYMRSFMQAGFMVMDPYSGEVKAWVGGINHKYFKYDHVNISTKRQVGSTIKPLVYCLAVDNGLSPCSSVSTAGQKFAGQAKVYNAGGSGGRMSMASALAASVNNASLYLLKQVGIQNFVDFVHRTGISSNIEKVPSIALGVSDISVFEMLWAYTMFPNSGVNTKPTMITKIEDKYGNVLDVFTPEQKEVVSAETAFKVVKMMMGVVNSGTGRSLRSYGLNGEMAGKTGTTNNQADAWYIGYTPQLLAGVWVGCDDRFLRFSSTYLGQGAKAALPIWGKFFKKVKADETLAFDEDLKFEEPRDFDYCSSKKVISGSTTGTYYPSSPVTTNDYDPLEEDLKNNENVIRDSSGNIQEQIPTIPDASHNEWGN